MPRVPARPLARALALYMLREAVPVEDLIYVGIPFVFLGLCLLYVRAADKL